MWWWRTKSDPEVEAALARVRIFASLPKRDLEKLAAECHLKRYEKGDEILAEGTTGLGLFLLTSGRAEVFKTLDERKIRLAVIGQGAVLGEMALLDDRPRSASAVALEPTDCLLLSRDRFRTLLERRPRIAWPIVPALAGRVRDLQAQLLSAQGGQPTKPAGDVDVEAPRSEPAPEGEAASGRAEGSAKVAGGDASCKDAESDDSGKDAEGDDSDRDLLRLPYALMMSGAVGVGESVRMVEVFWRSFDEESGLSDGKPMTEVVRRLPASLVAGGLSSWDAGRKAPVKVLDSFRDHLRATRREED